MARQLAEQGINTVLRDPGGIANGASSIPTTLLHARLLGDHSVTAEHRVSAYHHALAVLDNCPGVINTGALQLHGPNLSAAKLERIVTTYGADAHSQHHWIERLAPTALSARGLPDGCGDGLWFDGAKVVRTRALCHALTHHPLIHFSRDIADTGDGKVHVICSGMAARSSAAYAWLELAQVHGQVDRYWQPTTRFRVPVVGHGYYLPDGRSCTVGATYEYAPWKVAKATAQNHLNNVPYLHPHALWNARFRAARTVSSDRLPVVGQLDPTVWIATAFGSMGTSAAPFAAAQVASELLGWIPPVSTALAQALSPTRFLARQARRGKLRHWP
jgi:glycine/D-amino acid oxidase-like deaminating enzyme